MQKTILLTLLLVVWNCAGAQSQQENQEPMNAALRLKQAAVQRTLEDCKAKGGSVKSCNTLLELTHQREVKIIERLNLALTDPAVNADETSKEIAACSNPNYGYVETVECWSQLSDRLDASRKGQSLLRGAGSANEASAAEYSKAPSARGAAAPTPILIMMVWLHDQLVVRVGIVTAPMTAYQCASAAELSTASVKAQTSGNDLVIQFVCEVGTK